MDKMKRVEGKNQEMNVKKVIWLLIQRDESPKLVQKKRSACSA